MQLVRAALANLSGDSETLHEVFREACRDIVRDIGATRASIWFFNPTGDAIVCDCLYDGRTGDFTRGQVLAATEYPSYFDAIRAEARVVVADAETHPSTACFTEDYLRPNGIRAILDHIVWTEGYPVAILCCEQCGLTREWEAADATYLYQMATLLGIAFERRLAAAA